MAGLSDAEPASTDRGAVPQSPVALCVVDSGEHPDIVRRAESGAPLTVGLIGSGRAAAAVALSLRPKAGGNRVLVARHGESARRLARQLGTREMSPADVLGEADITILAVPDEAIAPLAVELMMSAPPGEGRVVAHLSGSLEAGVLAALACHGYAAGAIHPLQVLSARTIPIGTTFAVEGQEAALPVLSRLVRDLRGVELRLPDDSRLAYHAGATVAANLGMTLLAEALDLLAGAGIDRDAALEGLTTLMRGGLTASAERGLPGALTGPVTRGDVETVRRHLLLLKRDPALADAYRAVSVLALRQARRDGRPADADAAARMAELLGTELPPDGAKSRGEEMSA